MDQKIKDLWNNNKLTFLLLIVPVLIAIFRNSLIDLLISNSKKIAADTQNQDTALATQEKQANDQANQIVESAEKLSQDPTKVTEDWNKE